MSLTPIFRNNPRPDIYDPFYDIWDPFIDEPMIFAPQVSFHNSIISSRVVWQENPEAHVLRAELPGLKKDDVKVKVEEDGKILKISGKKEVEKEEKHKNRKHFEHSEGSFLRAFSLPENSRPECIKASMENGVLIVTVPKRDVKKSHVKDMEVKG
ncbi:Alpha crystallin [Handroanthus impetiginosus]|uniref:Alpha crystallin n=1 Tax=Handroanthus impetiginosus TaxID=429701 RepID=A0A2G9GSH5_9LAMI|nr:Alpha crystallin [Handroanthus impetiginosus]